MKGTVLSFYLKGRYLGVDIKRVKEMNRNIEYTVVPGAPDDVIGILNLRGQIVSLLDLLYLLEGQEYKPEINGETAKANACIILKGKSGGGQIGFVIDRPGDVVDLEDTICEPPPANLHARDISLYKEVARMDKELLMILDLDRLASLYLE